MDPWGCGAPYPTFAQAVHAATDAADEYYATQLRAAAAAAAEAVALAQSNTGRDRLKRISDEALERWMQHHGGAS